MGHLEFQVTINFYGRWGRVDTVTPQANFLRKITFDMLYTNEFVIRVRSRALSIPSECNTI